MKVWMVEFDGELDCLIRKEADVRSHLDDVAEELVKAEKWHTVTKNSKHGYACNIQLICDGEMMAEARRITVH